MGRYDHDHTCAINAYLFEPY